jgi:hypothetical protein
MDTTLVTVTILSMGMAAALSVIVWRLLRDERRRSEARIAALTEASVLSHSATAPKAGAGPSSAFRPPESKPANAIPPAGAMPHGGALPVKSGSDKDPERQRVEGKRSSSDDLPLHSAGATIASGALFVEPERSSPWGNRIAVMTGLALVTAAVVLVAMTAAKSRATDPPANPAAGATTAAEPASAGLELLSLRDARQDDTLTITGMVQNPRTGRPLMRAAVTAYAFDDKGTFLASGRALLDVTSLGPGDESPFLVTVPVTGAVARYRIGFRSEDGRVIAHVDKRQQQPMAALRQPNG